MAGGESPPRSTPLGSARPCGVGPGANGAGAPGPSRAVPSRAGGGGSGSSSMGLELYLDLLSQPCRSIYIFARSNNIPFEFKHVELFKGGTGEAGGRRGWGARGVPLSPPLKLIAPLSALWQTRCWARSRRQRAARSSPAQVRLPPAPQGRYIPVTAPLPARGARGWRGPGGAACPAR